MDFKVFSLNCWAIPVISKDRAHRMKAIAEALATNNYDVVCLQEVWTDTDFNLIKNKVKGSLPYSHYFYSGVIGSGVCILSKYPILDAFFHQWPVNGYIHKIQHADWFGGKGIGLCRLKVNGFNINVFSAHLHAEYNRLNDEYQAHRVLQAFDTAQFIRLTSSAADLVVLAGDLNTEPSDLAYRIIMNITGLKDSFLEASDESTSNIKSGTNEACINSYAAKSAIKDSDVGKRIDYVMYRTNSNIKAIVKRYTLPLPARVPDQNFSYSDHEAISSTLELERVEPIVESVDSETCSLILDESINIFEAALNNLRTTKRIYWFVTALLFVLLVCSIPFDAPYGYRYLVHVARVLLTLIICYTFVMGSLWNKIETHGILAGKLAMEIVGATYLKQ